MAVNMKRSRESTTALVKEVCVCGYNYLCGSTVLANIYNVSVTGFVILVEKSQQLYL